MVESAKKDFTKEVKMAYRNSLQGDTSLLLGLILEITVGNRGKLFVLRDKEGKSIYSYYISPSAFEHGDVKDSHYENRTIQLGISEVTVAQTIIQKIKECGLGNIAGCVIVENLAKATFDYLKPLVEAIFEGWPDEFQNSVFEKLKEILYGEANLGNVIALIKNQLGSDLPAIVQPYQELYKENLVANDITDDTLIHIAEAIVWYIEQKYGADF
jgi:hypothetical protein